MKNENVVFGLGAVLVLAGASMKIFHMPYAEIGEIISRLTFIGAFFYLAFTNAQLKKKLKQLEGENK